MMRPPQGKRGKVRLGNENHPPPCVSLILLPANRPWHRPGSCDTTDCVGSWREWLRTTADRLQRDVHALGLACRDPRVPWYAKVLAVCVVAYALSPIDLIPDFIPVIGYLDDVVLVPLGIALVLRMVPAEVMTDCRQRAEENPLRSVRWVAAAGIVTCWLGSGFLIWRWWQGPTA